MKCTNKKKWNLCAFTGLLLALCLLFTGCSLSSFIEDGKYISQEAELYNQAVDDFFAALDSQDKEAIMDMFAQDVREEDTDLEAQIDKLFEAYPGPTDICKRDGSSVAGSYSNDHGTHTSSVESGFPVVSHDTYYWCDFEYMYENDEDEDQIGIRRISFYSAEARCKEIYEPVSRTGSMDKGADTVTDGLTVLTDVSVDYEVRFVGGYPEKFTPIDRTLTAEQVTAFLETSSSYSAFLAEFGSPNVEDTSGVSVTYELPPEDGEPRYLDLFFDDSTDQILKVYIQNDLDVVAVSKLWDAEESKQ